MLSKDDYAAATAAPAWALLIWCDHRDIYVQLPGPQGPCVLAYPRSEGGLAKALSLMSSRHATEGAGAQYTTLAVPLNPQNKPAFSINQREAMRDLLKRKGVL